MQGQTKPNIGKLRKTQNSRLSGGTFGGHHAIGYFGWQPLSKIRKVATIAQAFKMEICNKNQAALT